MKNKYPCVGDARATQIAAATQAAYGEAAIGEPCVTYRCPEGHWHWTTGVNLRRLEAGA